MGIIRKYQSGNVLKVDGYKPTRDSLLLTNKNMPMIKRVLNPEFNKGKEVFIGDSKDPSTHFMEYSSGDGAFWVYPRVQLQKDGTLKDEGDNAYNKARDNGNAIKFDTEEEAKEFSWNYKTEQFKKGYVNRSKQK